MFPQTLQNGGASPILRGFLVYIHLERSGVCKWQVAVGFIRWRRGAVNLLPPSRLPHGGGDVQRFCALMFPQTLQNGGASPTLRDFPLYIHLERSGVCKWQEAVGFIRWRRGAVNLLSSPQPLSRYASNTCLATRAIFVPRGEGLFWLSGCCLCGGY